MKICIPFTHLRSETFLACPQARLFPLKNHEWSYADYWLDQWQIGQTFINVEHDVVPMGNVLQEMWDCPEPYCRTDYAYPFAGSRIDTSPIGCAKFSSDFIAEHHGIFIEHLHWHDPQYMILNASLNQAHVHTPPSLHLHVQEDWPLEAKRRFMIPV